MSPRKLLVRRELNRPYFSVQPIFKNDNVKEDALAHLLDQLLSLTERIEEIERKQSKQ